MRPTPIIAAPSSTKNAQGERDAEMVDANSGLVPRVITTAANEADVEQISDLLHGKERHLWADSGYRGAQTRVTRDSVQWHIAARPSDIRAKVEHPFRVIKRQIGLVKVRFRGLAKNTALVITLFALSNLWMARKRLPVMAGAFRPQTA